MARQTDSIDMHATAIAQSKTLCYLIGYQVLLYVRKNAKIDFYNLVSQFSIFWSEAFPNTNRRWGWLGIYFYESISALWSSYLGVDLPAMAYARA